MFVNNRVRCNRVLLYVIFRTILRLSIGMEIVFKAQLPTKGTKNKKSKINIVGVWQQPQDAFLRRYYFVKKFFFLELFKINSFDRWDIFCHRRRLSKKFFQRFFFHFKFIFSSRKWCCQPLIGLTSRIQSLSRRSWRRVNKKIVEEKNVNNFS